MLTLYSYPELQPMAGLAKLNPPFVGSAARPAQLQPRFAGCAARVSFQRKDARRSPDCLTSDPAADHCRMVPSKRLA